uniref:Uncharacterized protein n=1 Tax=Setaria viridis TaxID=4556 RepID=A0A4U6V240_SETVI|nr:hypothetical protein SEVIR_4G165200v2 [Setaria viridis]
MSQHWSGSSKLRLSLHLVQLGDGVDGAGVQLWLADGGDGAAAAWAPPGAWRWPWRRASPLSFLPGTAATAAWKKGQGSGTREGGGGCTKRGGSRGFYSQKARVCG